MTRLISWGSTGIIWRLPLKLHSKGDTSTQYLIQAKDNSSNSVLLSYDGLWTVSILEQYEYSQLSGQDISSANSILWNMDKNGDGRDEIFISEKQSNALDVAYAYDNGSYKFRGFDLLDVDETNKTKLLYITDLPAGATLELQCLTNTELVPSGNYQVDRTWVENGETRISKNTTKVSRGSTWTTIQNASVASDNVNI